MKGPTDKVTAILLLCIVAPAVAFASFYRESPQAHAVIQLTSFPFLLLAFSRLRILQIRLPRWIVLFALFGSLGGALMTYSHVDLANRAFVVARFADDDLENVTKITRDRIRRVIGWNGVTMVGSHYETIVNSSAAFSLLRTSPHLSGVIWGTPRWINVTLQQSPNIDIDHLSHGRVELEHTLKRRVPNLQIITSAPSVGMSGSSEYPTVEFLARLVETWGAFYSVISLPRESPDFEMAVRGMAGIKAAWTSSYHRALPMWMTGTYHLTRAISNADIELGEISCALGSFDAASLQLRPDDSAELQVSIINNQAVTLVIRSLLTGNPKKGRMLAKKLLNRAFMVAKVKLTDPTQMSALQTVKANLAALNHKQGPGKKGTRRSLNVSDEKQNLKRKKRVDGFLFRK